MILCPLVVVPQEAGSSKDLQIHSSEIRREADCLSFNSSVDITRIDTIFVSPDSGDRLLLDETIPCAQRRLASCVEASATILLSSPGSDHGDTAAKTSLQKGNAS